MNAVLRVEATCDSGVTVVSVEAKTEALCSHPARSPMSSLRAGVAVGKAVVTATMAVAGEVARTAHRLVTAIAISARSVT